MPLQQPVPADPFLGVEQCQSESFDSGEDLQSEQLLFRRADGTLGDPASRNERAKLWLDERPSKAISS